MAQVMLEYFIAFAHLGTILSLFMIIRGCYGIHAELPVQGSEISARIDRTADLLDEVTQIISDFADSVPASSPQAGSDSPFGLILNSLLNRTPMDENYGSPKSEWTVQENNPSPLPQETD